MLCVKRSQTPADTARVVVLVLVLVHKESLRTNLKSWGRMHDADVSASLRLKLTYDGLAH